MSQLNYDVANQKDLEKRGISLDTIITPDNKQLFLSRELLIQIGNRISLITGSIMTKIQMTDLFNYIKNLPFDKYKGLTYNNAATLIAKLYLDRNVVKKNLIESEYKTNPINLANLNEITPTPTIVEYQVEEIKQFTNNENQYKYSAFADRRGNAFIDYKKVNDNFSSPDSLPPGKKITNDELNKENYETLKLVKNFLDPHFISDLINRFSSTYTNYQSINLPHQTFPLDSRNRVLYNDNNSNNLEYTWSLTFSGLIGQQGNLNINDTLQQIMQIKIGSFWLPMYPIAGSYYNKIRMLIKEFNSQSNRVTEFIDSDPTIPTTYNFHFEFNITQTIGNRVFLEPVNDIFTFRKPFAMIDTLTISFRTPFNQLILQPDRGVYTLTYGFPTVLTITSGTTGISTGDLIYILNSDSGNTTIDTYLNRSEGYIATKISDTEFSIPVDTSILVGSETGINVYYGSKRIFFDLNFITLEQ